MMWADLIKYRWERAQEALMDAKKDNELSSYRSATNRAYYAMFYGALAVLATKRLGSSKHSGVISLFNREFIKKGLISKEASHLFHKGFESRIKGDYKDFSVVTEGEASSLISSAERFLQEIRQFLDTHPPPED
jgi:uncharacterized protein (UPF0332 family)